MLGDQVADPRVDARQAALERLAGAGADHAAVERGQRCARARAPRRSRCCAVPGSMPRTTTIGVILRSGPDAFGCGGRAPVRRRPPARARRRRRRSWRARACTSSCSSSASISRISAPRVGLLDRRPGGRPHHQLGGVELDAGALQRLAHGGEVLGRGDHLEHVLVERHVLGAGVDRRHQVVLRVACARPRRARPSSRRSRPPSPARRGCRRRLVKAWRTSEPVRLRLSVSASTSTATPPGP